MNSLTKKQEKSPSTQTQETATAPQARRQRSVRPGYRVRETDNGFSVQVDVPGVAKEDLQIELRDSVLQIAAGRSWSGASDWQALSGNPESELVYRLNLSVGDEVDADGITAALDSGVLTLSLPKEEKKRPRSITIG